MMRLAPVVPGVNPIKWIVTLMVDLFAGPADLAGQLEMDRCFPRFYVLSKLLQLTPSPHQPFGLSAMLAQNLDT